MKKAFTLIELLAVILIIGIIGLIAIPSVTQSIKNSKQRTYESQVQTIIDSSKRWAADNVNSLPEMGNSATISVSVNDLITKGYIQKTENGSIINPVNNTKMNGCVKINYSMEYNQYIHEYDELCDIKETSLVKILRKQYKEGTTTGLLKEGENYYYRGTNTEVANNFVWYEGHLWRVIQVNSNNTITMITQQPITAIEPGNDEYETSHINTWLNDVFYNSISDKSKIQKATFNISLNPKKTKDQYVGLLDEEQNDRSGLEGSFIKNYDPNTFYTIPILIDHFIKETKPVISISDLTINDGNGTLSNPFREKSTSINTNSVKVGEYVSVPGSSSYCGTDARCLFRVVSKDSDSVKVILNGLLPEKSQFRLDEDTPTIPSSPGIPNIKPPISPGEPFIPSAKINTPLIAFANSISTTYRYSGNKIFNIGFYNSYGSYEETNYTVVSNRTYSGNVGLPIIGEMFSADDISFFNGNVNVDTIENSLVKPPFWSMNDFHPMGNYIMEYGLVLGGINDYFSVRPTLFLNKGTSSDLTFTRGDGTAENPYWLGN